MRALAYNSKGVDVGLLQGWLNTFEQESLSIDNDYKTKTKEAVERYQRKYGLEVDGKAGPITLTHMGFRIAKNNKIMVLTIPFNRIGKAKVLLQDGKAYSVDKFAKEEKLDIVWNGAFFELSTRKIVQFLMQEGQIKSWGMGYEGIVYPNNFTEAFGDTYGSYAGKPYDMQGSAPTLIKNYVRATHEINAFNKTIYNSSTKRNCTGVTNIELVIMLTRLNCTMEEMVQEGLYQKIKFLQGNDGGGSQSIFMGGKTIIPTDGRAIPAAVGLTIKPTIVTPEKLTIPEQPIVKKKKICLDAGHGVETPGKRAPDESYFEHEFNLDMSKKMEEILIAHGVEVIQTRTTEKRTGTTENNDATTRANIANTHKDLAAFISIHSNAAPGTGWIESARGWTIYTSVPDEKAERNKLADCIVKYAKESGIILRSPPHKYALFTVLAKTNAPACLIEHGFHTSKQDVALLKSDWYRNKLAIINCKGILEYLGITWEGYPEYEDNSTEPVEEEKPNILYRVQVGVFAVKENAQNLSAELRGLGYSTIIVEEKK